MNTQRLILGFWFVFAMSLVFLMPTASAKSTVSIQGYYIGNDFTPSGDGGTIPLGSEISVRVWVGCEGARIYWGDGESDTIVADSWAPLVTHKYEKAGTYEIYATDQCSSGKSQSQTITVGGSTPAVAFVQILVVGVGIFTIIIAVSNNWVSLYMFFKKVPPPHYNASGDVLPVSQTPKKPKSIERKLGQRSPEMATNLVSMNTVPSGAEQQFPTVGMELGKPTDVFAKPLCRHCQTPTLGYTAMGWFCMNPLCKGRQPPPGVTSGYNWTQLQPHEVKPHEINPSSKKPLI